MIFNDSCLHHPKTSLTPIHKHQIGIMRRGAEAGQQGVDLAAVVGLVVEEMRDGLRHRLRHHRLFGSRKP